MSNTILTNRVDRCHFLPTIKTICWILLFVVIINTYPLLHAQAITDESVQQGQQALQDLGDVPWYDPAEDDVCQLKEPNRSWWPGLTDRSGFGSLSGTLEIAALIRYAVWSVLAIILLTLVVLLIRHMLRQEFPEWKIAGEAKNEASAMHSLTEKLPIPIDTNVGNFLTHARQLYEQQRFSEAIIYYFCYQLVELDHRQMIRLARGKTNRQYLRELHAHRALQPLFQRSMIAFEDVFFGNHALSRERFDACWNQLAEFERLTHANPAGTSL